MDRTGLTRPSVHERSLTTAATSTRRDFKSNTFQRQSALLFNTNKWNEYSATQLEMFHLWQVCLYLKMFKKLTFQWRRSRIYMEKPDLTDLIFLCLHGQGPYLICATWEEKNWIGSLEPCCVNAAFGKLPTTITQVQTVFVPGFVVFGLHGVLQSLGTHFLATLVRWRAWPLSSPNSVPPGFCESHILKKSAANQSF